MKLALVRHAQRSWSAPSIDDQGLSPSGQGQAAAVSRRMIPEWKGTIPRLLSSPKKRCLETAEAIGNDLGIEVEILLDLDECNSGEGPSQLESRVESFLEATKLGAWGDSVIAVSHSDWLERAAFLLFEAKLELQWGYATTHLIDLNLQKATFIKTI